MATEAAGKRKFHTERFEKAASERKETVLRVALEEFSSRGFHGASVNDIARKAGISIGSLYSYFPTKDDLFLSLVGEGHDLLEEALSDIDPEAPFFESLASMLRKAHDYGKLNPGINHIYQEATTQALRHLAARLSYSLESLTAALYRRMIEAAKARGEIRGEADPGMSAFCLDNLVLNFQFSATSDYYRDRLAIFLGREIGSDFDPDEVIPEVVSFARRALAPS